MEKFQFRFSVEGIKFSSRNVLGYVFDLFDFDGKIICQNEFYCFLFDLLYLGNQQLDRKEYNLWTIRTTGDEITDEDWSSIRG